MIPVDLNISDKATKNLITIVVSLLVLFVVVYFLWKFKGAISQAIQDNRTANRIKEENDRTNDIAEQAGVSQSQVEDALNIALNVAREMATSLNTPWYAYNTNESAVINHLDRVQSTEQMLLVSEFYRDDATDRRSLKADLESYLNKNERNQILYINALS